LTAEGDELPVGIAKIYKIDIDNQNEARDFLPDAAKLPTFHGRSTLVNVVIEMSKGMPLKLKYDERYRVLRVHKALPLGFTFAPPIEH